MRNILLSLLFVGGLVLAGSDGFHFPVPNVAGLCCWLLMIALLKGKKKLPPAVGDRIPDHQWFLLTEALEWGGSERKLMRGLRRLSRRHGIAKRPSG